MHDAWFGLLQAGYVFAMLFGAAAALRRQGWAPVEAICGAVAGLGVAAFVAIIVDWFALPDTRVQLVVGAMAIATVVFLFAQALSRRQWTDEVAIPCGLGFLFTGLLLVWAYHGFGDVDPLAVAASRWTHELPVDNRLPFFLSKAFLAGQVPVGQPTDVMGDWLYSDRPPLQSALFMLTPGFQLDGADPFAYEAASVAAEMLALVGVWALVRSATRVRWVAAAALGATVFTPLVLVNGLYVWPKLLAAAFLLCLAALHLSPHFKTVSQKPLTGLVVGALAALAMLAHGASAFAILGIALASIVSGRFGSWRYGAAVALAAVVVYMPWAAYQTLVDPPGNRLLKWHIAGVVPIDGRSFLHTLRDSYRDKSLGELLAARKSNVAALYAQSTDTIRQTLEAGEALAGGDVAQAASLGKALRESQFFHVLAGTGVLGAFFVLGLGGLAFADTRPLVLSIAATMLVWVGLLFAPESAIIHQGSYFPELAVIALGAILLSKFSRFACMALLALHCGVTLFQYSI